MVNFSKQYAREEDFFMENANGTFEFEKKELFLNLNQSDKFSLHFWK